MPDSPAVKDWVEQVRAGPGAPASADVGALFGEECYWRDFVAFTWNIITLEGRDAIAGHAARSRRRRSAASGFAPTMRSSR